jgi:hypothetical protein
MCKTANLGLAKTLILKAWEAGLAIWLRRRGMVSRVRRAVESIDVLDRMRIEWIEIEG